MKLPIISEDAGAKIACGRGTGNYYNIISDGLISSILFSFDLTVQLSFPGADTGGMLGVLKHPPPPAKITYRLL